MRHCQAETLLLAFEANSKITATAITHPTGVGDGSILMLYNRWPMPTLKEHLMSRSLSYCGAALMACGLWLLSTLAFAQPLNLNPGLWEYTNVLQLTESAEPQTQVFEGCVTQADLDDGAFMRQDIAGCEMIEQQLSADQLSYAMNCQGPEGTELRIAAEIAFNGDTATGVINNIVATPMGDMTMVVNVTARRVGECDTTESQD